MTKDEIIKLIDKKYHIALENQNKYKEDYSYYAGEVRGLLVAKELIGMLDKPNNKSINKNG